MRRISPWWAAVVLVLGAGCSQSTINSADNDIQHDVGRVTRKAQPKLEELDLGARVTAAIQANANLPRTIRADASPTGVRLKGDVQTAKQKRLAGEIAKQTLKPGENVDNQLKVTGA